mgnify:CR=1 FL=1
MTWRGREPHGDDARLGKACSCRLCPLHRGEEEIATLRARLAVAEQVVRAVAFALHMHPHADACGCPICDALAVVMSTR